MPMTDQDRGALLVQQEKSKKRVSDIEADLKRRGEILVKFGSQVRDRPDHVVFSNAPSPLGNLPHELLALPSYEWSQTLHALDLTGIAQAVQDLRAARNEAADITRRLAQN